MSHFTDLNLKWKTRCNDCVLCFKILNAGYGYIVHGELSILRLNNTGEVQWEFSGNDIFTTPDGTDIFTVEYDGSIVVNDWNHVVYKISPEGNLIG